MNKEQRKVARDVSGKLRGQVEQLEFLRDGLQEYADSRSEKWAETENGEKHNTEISAIEAAIESLESAADALDEVNGDD